MSNSGVDIPLSMQSWADSGIPVFDNFAEVGAEVSTQLVNYFRASARPALDGYSIMQAGEAVGADPQGRKTYLTFVRDETYFYIDDDVAEWQYAGECRLGEHIPASGRSVLDKEPRFVEDPPGCAPAFVHQIPLPPGWSWHVYDDGSGSLFAPDGSKCLEYDAGRMCFDSTRNSWGAIPSAYEIYSLVSQTIIPGWQAAEAVRSAHPDCYVAFGPSSCDVIPPRDATSYSSVAISSDLVVDATEFWESLKGAHAAERAGHADHAITIGEWAHRLARAIVNSPDGNCCYEGVIFRLSSFKNLRSDASAVPSTAEVLSALDLAARYTSPSPSSASSLRCVR